MSVSRLIFKWMAVLFIHQTDALDVLSLLRPVTPVLQPILDCPLLNTLPLNLTAPIKQLLGAVKLENYPNLESSIAKYNSYTDENRPKCCRPEQFPDLFTFLFDFFSAFENISIKAMQAVCQILQLLTPLGCKHVFTGKQNGLLGVGCVVDKLIGPLFGKLGELAGTIIVRVFGPLDKIDGCLITGTAQIFNKFKYGKPNTKIGTAVGPASIGSILLAVAITTSYCLAEPLTSFMGDAYIVSWQEIEKLCEKEAAKGYWDKIY